MHRTIMILAACVAMSGCSGPLVGIGGRYTSTTQVNIGSDDNLADATTDSEGGGTVKDSIKDLLKIPAVNKDVLRDLINVPDAPLPPQSPEPPPVVVVPPVVVAPAPAPSPDTEEPAKPPVGEFSLDQIDEWKHADVSGWAQTATLTASLDGEMMTLDYDKAGVWPPEDALGRGGLVANAWIAWQEDGRWIASTWEWMTPNQDVKEVDNIRGMGVPSGTVYVWVSGLARNAVRNVKERSNAVALAWR